MEQDEDEKEKNYGYETENEKNEEKQVMDDSMNNIIEPGSEDDSDDNSAINNRILLNEKDGKGASEDESDVEIHDETSKDMYSGTVLFIRNLSFDATEEELSNM